MRLYEQKAVTSAYPGYDANGNNMASPRPAPRVKPEAQEIADRNRGSIDIFGSAPPKPRIEPKPEPRCKTGDAMANYELGRNGLVSNLLNGSATPRPDSARAPRVKPEAESIAYEHSGNSTKNLFNNYGNFPRSARGAPRVKAEAGETAEQHRGGRMNNLLHDSKKLPMSARAVPRVKGEGQDNASLEGKGMNKVLHSQPLTNRPVPRVSQAAMTTAEHAQGGDTKNLFGKYGKLPLDPKPEPKCHGEGSRMCRLDQGGRLSRLMHETSSLPQDPRPAPRATTSAARRIMKSHQGQMSQIFAASSTKVIVPAAGR